MTWQWQALILIAAIALGWVLFAATIRFIGDRDTTDPYFDPLWFAISPALWFIRWMRRR